MKRVLALLHNRNLTLLLLGRIVSSGGDWLYLVALSIAIYRYSHGNSVYIGVLWIARLVPSLAFRPFGGALADRIGYRPAMITADIGRMGLVALLALILSPSTWGVIPLVAFLVTSFSSIFRPASVGLVASIVRSKEERLTANAVLIQGESIAMIAGSALGGIVAGRGLITQLLLIEAATFGASALSLWFIHPPEGAARKEPAAPARQGGDAEQGVVAGFRLLRQRPLLVFAATIMALPEFASGALVVWFVPYSVHNLHLGGSGVGYLYATLGAGAFLGGFVAAALGSAVELDQLLTGSVLVVGVGLTLLGSVPFAALSLALALVLGIAETVEYAAYGTLLQQAVPDSMMGRASGTMDSFFFNMMLLGNLLSGVLAGLLGLTVSIAGLGVLTVLAAVAAWWNLRLTTQHAPEAALLASIPVFDHVPPDIRQWAVRRMVREQFAPGAVVVRQGDEGDKFYTIAEGSVEVQVDAGERSSTRTLGPGDFFGEIALLRRIPRTATVRASKPLTVYALSREDFQELQERASGLRESLLEVAAARLASNSGLMATVPALHE